MTAKEMFEKLGYELDCDDINDNYLSYGKDYEYITFNLKEKTFDKLYAFGDADPINIKELQAINKQVEELGWK